MATVENLPSRLDRAPDRLRPAEAQGGRALHPRQGHLPRRHPAAGHGARRDPAQPLRARAHRLDRHLRALAHPNVAAVVTAKDLETLGLAWMPTISYDTQAVLAGDKVRFQGQEVAFVIATDEYSRQRRAPADRRRVRAAAGDRQRAQGARPRRAADPRRQDRPARQPRQPDLGGRRRGGHRPRVRRGRHGRHARHHLPALPPGAARDVRDHRRLQPGDRPARHLQRQPGAARAPHGLRARRRARRAHDPDPLPRHRRRLRQQGAGLSGLRVRDRRLDRRRRARQVGREPLREPDVHGLRARLRHARRDVLEGRQDHRPAGRRDRRPRRVRQHRAADQVPGRVLPHLLRLVRPRRPRTSRSRRSTRTRRPAASPTAARSASPRPSTSSSAWSTRSRSR